MRCAGTLVLTLFLTFAATAIIGGCAADPARTKVSGVRSVPHAECSTSEAQSSAPRESQPTAGERRTAEKPVRTRVPAPVARAKSIVPASFEIDDDSPAGDSEAAAEAPLAAVIGDEVPPNPPGEPLVPAPDNAPPDLGQSPRPSLSDPSIARDSPHVIDLPTVLELVNGQNPQVLFARERIQEAFAQLERAQVLWLPSVRAGITYDKHEGPAQQIDGHMINTSRSALFSGLGGVLPGAATPAIPGIYANFLLTDAIFQPRIAQRTAASRESAACAATNDALLDSALAYLELLRAAQDLAIAREARDNTQQLADLTGAYAQTGQGTQADYDRALAELALRSTDVERTDESIRVASTRLAQQLSLDPLFFFEPREPIVVPIEMVSAQTPPADLVAQGLTCRPEVSESRYLVAEAVERLKREQYAPLIPSVLLGIGYGGFGGAEGGSIRDFRTSFDSVIGAFWEVRNLGFGEYAARSEARSRIFQSQWREVAVLDRVAREVVEAHVQVESRRRQLAIAEEGIRAAVSSYERNLDRIRHVQGLPLEVLQSIQALAQARRDYLRVVVSYNEAQFRLHRALGWPTGNEPTSANG